MKKYLFLLAIAISACGLGDEPTSGITSTPNFNNDRVVNILGEPVANCEVVVCLSQEEVLSKAVLSKSMSDGSNFNILKTVDTLKTDKDGYFNLSDKFKNKKISLSAKLHDSLVCFEKEYIHDKPLILKKSKNYKKQIDPTTVGLESLTGYKAMIEGTPFVTDIINNQCDFKNIPEGDYNIIIVSGENSKYNVIVQITINITIINQYFINDTNKVDTLQKIESEDTSLVAYWSFNNSNSNDELGNYNGTNFGNITYVDGINGKAAKFDGSSYINVGDVEFNPANVSFAVWVKAESTTGKILSKNGGNPTNSDLNVTLELDGKYDGGFSINEIEHEFTAPIGTNDYVGLATPSVDTYDYIVITYDNTNLKYYINGELVKNISTTGSISNGLQDLVFGAWTMDPTRELFTGYMDEIKIYNKALSIDEISSEYNANKQTSNDIEPIAYWSFDKENSNDELGTYLGTNFGNITYVEGVNGLGAQFDGASYIETNYYHTLLDSFSVSVWVKSPDSLGCGDILSNHSNNTNAGIVIKREEYDGFYNLEITSNNVYYDLKQGSAEVYGGYGLAEPNYESFDFIVETFDGTYLSLYVNGELIKKLEIPGKVANSTYPLYIGSYAGAPLRDKKPLTGTIDEVKIYDKILSQSQIIQEFQKY